VRRALEHALPHDAALVLPSAATVAPVPNLDQRAGEDLRTRTIGLTCLAGLAGAPAVSLPLGQVDGRPVGVCLLGRVGEDERLLAAAAAVGQRRDRAA
ncbi:MAG: amidase family protein, partial [Solirubrobacteraceae bacterium]